MPPVSSERLAVGLLFIVVAVLACLAPAQGDTWWLLRAGEDIWTTHAVPLIDTYSHTAFGSYWPNHEWLTEVTFYALHRLGGLPLVAGVAASAITTAWLVSWRVSEGPFEARFVLFSASLIPCAIGWAIRPQVFSFLMFATVCVVVCRGRFRWLPVLMLVWSNLHGAAVLGFAAIAGALLAEWLHRRRFPIALAAAGLLGVAATFVTPLGWRLYSFIPDSMARSAANQLIEWSAPDLSPVLLPFWGVVTLLAVLTLLRAKRLDIQSSRLTGIALAMMPLAIQSRRNIPIFLLVGVPAVLRLLDHATERLKPRGENERANAAILAVSGALAALFVAEQWSRPAPGLGWRPMSEELVNAVSACKGPIYNTYEDGGALIWFARARVFVDNRQDPYPIEVLRAAQTVERGGPIDAVVDRYRVACAVAPVNSNLAATLASSDRWRLRYQDPRWQIYDLVSPINATVGGPSSRQ